MPLIRDSTRKLLRDMAIPQESGTRQSWHAVAGELALIVLVFALYAGAPPPGVNESHYLGKAKQYWQPDWCAGDFFFESADAHATFFWTFGWITRFVSLTQAAWIGRFAVWLLLAMSWRRLVTRLTPRPWSALFSVVLLVPLIHFTHLSGEWLIGGVEAKGFAYALVFWGIASAVEGCWWRVWPLLGLAASFHVLVGGWAVLACLSAWILRRERDQLSTLELVVWLTLGGICAIPGLWPAIALTREATVDVYEASRIYTYRRVKHHLVFQAFPWWNVIRFTVLVWTWWKLTTRTAMTDRVARLWGIVVGSLFVTACGIAVDFATGPFLGLRAHLLRYYWFRLSDICVPMGLALAILLTDRVVARPRWMSKLLPLSLLLGLVGLAVGMQSSGIGARSTGMQQQSWPGLDATPKGQDVIDEDWIDVCHWVRDHVATSSMFLTPRRQQTFKWFAERPCMVTWKDVPQDANGLVEWWTRHREVYPLRLWPWDDLERLAMLRAKYHITHVVWPRREGRERPVDDVPAGKLLYQNQSFFVYEFPPTVLD